MPHLNIAELTGAWATLVENLGAALRRIESKDDHSRTVELLDVLLAATREEEKHPLCGLVEVLADLVEDFESRTLREPDAPPADVLRLLMDSSDLKQTDLAEEVGGQSVVSAILNGHRQINAKQAAALAARFGVSPAVFIAKAPATSPPKKLSPVKRPVARQVSFSQTRLYTREKFVTKEARGVVLGVSRTAGISFNTQTREIRIPQSNFHA
jgi:HTH-type transcriptional regulator / antitoxin HigA